jgi:hypothetical protein
VRVFLLAAANSALLISHVISAGLLNIVCIISFNRLNELSEAINQYVAVTDVKKNVELKEGLLVIAKHPCDDR